MAEKQVCVVCGKPSQDIPLLGLTYKNEQFWICPQDFPTLIHKPEKLVGKLPGAEKLVPSDHHD
jgi:hypothetical protein